jgi:hypothetical protein
MITIVASRGDNKTSYWILSLEDFPPFMSHPSFRLCEEKHINFYSTFVFGSLDDTYAENFLSNFNNYAIEDFQDYLKEIALDEMF